MNNGYGIDHLVMKPRTVAPPPPARGSRLRELVQAVKPAGWHRQAACADKPKAWWFADEGGQYKNARSVCAVCPVRRDCLEDALESNVDHGMWGGFSPGERDAYRAAKRSATTARIHVTTDNRSTTIADETSGTGAASTARSLASPAKEDQQ